MIPETFSYIESKMPNYVCLAAKQHNYFVATLLRKGRVYLDHHTVKDFHTSRFQGLFFFCKHGYLVSFPSMGRHVLAAQAHCGSVKLDLFNTHLESTKDHAEERGRQLKQCLAQVHKGLYYHLVMVITLSNDAFKPLQVVMIGRLKAHRASFNSRRRSQSERRRACR